MSTIPLARPVALLAVLALAACDTVGSGDPDFGAAYVLDPASATLDGGVLRATVSYSGGCQEHTFRADSRRANGGVEVWLVHGGTPDPCEAAITETVVAPVDIAADAVPVVLLAPPDTSVLLRAAR
ncbi:hypothetical protein [Rubrivirga sp.]|uniref:hypothetical protein n=1 Tax=Rubrivirga sp. TaxID=1885344 RepID=UPI003B5224F8